jgi:outer membrane protein assembly factor BamD (BamD/ComL family)
MDRQHRHDLKHDRFVDEIGALSNRARDNQRLLMTLGAAVVIVALIAYGVYFYRSNREDQAQQALATAITTIDSPLIGAQQQPNQPPDPNAKFKTDQERSAAAEKQFKEVQDKFSGSDASDVAGLYLARLAAGRGDSATARKLLQNFVDEQSGHMLVASARYSLYQMRIDSGEAQQVVTELDAELAKAEPILPADSLLSLLAHAYDVQGNTAKSRDAYRRIVTEFPDSPYVLEAQRRVGA